ncbi:MULTISPECIES: hypothetical protein [unclassified Agarivorans]|uniref:hypothetical protein n=1 Tax=unclassified Agarivorans TaxID=2636026 RepID=UPI0026E36C88|nr:MULTISPECIES: hypothetical protein [unclassified Agarivorans]MDO6687544.1 hypothetical protein [Agarivorans sp. 3_MG-2023]MDO6717123.1 hypothetical protein [Agarivorans sp. 2_MG-2023]
MMSAHDIESNIVAEPPQITEANASNQRMSHSGVSLQARYEHHKSRHQYYKKAYKHVRKYRWISVGLAIVAFSAVFFLIALLPSYNQLKDDYADMHTDAQITQDQNRQLKDALLIERRNNFDLNKENHPELRVFAFDTLIATDQAQIRSAFFEASDHIGKHMEVSYQLLAEGPIKQPLAIVLVDQTGQQVHQQTIDFGELQLKEGESRTVESTMSLAKDLDVRYFKVMALKED